MELEKYTVKVTAVGIDIAEPLESTCHANNGSYYKIYVLKHAKEVHYVGLAKQKIKARFNGSFRAYQLKKEKGVSVYNGYSGYKWIETFISKKDELELFVFAFPDKVKKDDRNFMESIEAEVVFLVRSNFPYNWPKSQHEVHFHNIEGAKEIAAQIFEDINK
jgi:hypothetical protein